jgi:hypothetical protein
MVRWAVTAKGKTVPLQPDPAIGYAIPDTSRVDWREPRVVAQRPQYQAHQPFCELARRLKGAA